MRPSSFRAYIWSSIRSENILIVNPAPTTPFDDGGDKGPVVVVGALPPLSARAFTHHAPVQDQLYEFIK